VPTAGLLARGSPRPAPLPGPLRPVVFVQTLTAHSCGGSSGLWPLGRTGFPFHPDRARPFPEPSVSSYPHIEPETSAGAYLPAHFGVLRPFLCFFREISGRKQKTIRSPCLGSDFPGSFSNPIRPPRDL